jgi:hypothetical protein
VAQQLIQQRPPEERIGIFRWGTAITQASDFIRDRRLLSAQLKQATLVDKGPLLSLAQALEAIREDLEGVESPTFQGIRALFVIAPHLKLTEEFPDSISLWLRAVVKQWKPSLIPTTSMKSKVLELASEGAEDESIARLSTALDRTLSKGFHTLSLCPPSQSSQLLLRILTPTIQEIPVVLPSARVALLRPKACPPSSSSSPRLPFPQSIDLIFSEDERAVYQARLKDNSKEPFAAQVRMQADEQPISAKVKLRGQSSLACSRRNYAINLTGKEPYPLMKGAASDEFFLISLCLDNRYINQYTANQLMGQLGLFPFHFQWVELRIEQKSRGLYLLLEKPEQALRDNHSRVQAIFRRVMDIDQKEPEIVFAKLAPTKALEQYQQMLQQMLHRTGSALLDELNHHLDLPSYLRWIALMTLLGNGDYTDEVFYMATESVNEQGQASPFYSIFSWDADDLFCPCHHQGRFALRDPYGLLYCTESVLDHHIFKVPQIYALYVDILEEVLKQITPTVFQDALNNTTAGLLKWLTVEPIRLAMGELLERNPKAAQFAEATQDILQSAEQLMQKFKAQHELLLLQLQKYQATKKE